MDEEDNYRPKSKRNSRFSSETVESYPSRRSRDSNPPKYNYSDDEDDDDENADENSSTDEKQTSSSSRPRRQLRQIKKFHNFMESDSESDFEP